MLVTGAEDSTTVLVVGIWVETTVCVSITVTGGSSAPEPEPDPEPESPPPSPPLPSMGTMEYVARAAIDLVGVLPSGRNGKAEAAG